MQGVVYSQLHDLSRNRSSANVRNVDISKSSNMALQIRLSNVMYLAIGFCTVVYNILVRWLYNVPLLMSEI